MTGSTSNDTFNARHKSPVEVAKHFIPPPQFNELLGFNNSILVGPRGSGKTTLLKMLQVSALIEWNKSSASDGVSEIGFIGVFVAADVRWAKQLELITKEIVDSRLKCLIHESSFSNFVRLSLVEALERSIFHGVLKSKYVEGDKLDRVTEAELAKKLCQLWKVREAPSFSSLKHELRINQSEIPEVASRLAIGHDLAMLRQEYNGLVNDWLNPFTLAVETINDHLKVDDQKWGLLVDELEIIPKELLVKILAPLRSTTSNLVFKFAISPTGAGSQLLIDHEEADATQGNDFSPLRLWTARKQDTRQFTSRLLLQSLRARGLASEGEDLLNILGSSGGVEESTDDDGDGGRLSLSERRKLFESLALKDESFREYIQSKKIVIDDLQTSDSSVNGTMVRKITPLVFLRNHVLKSWVSGTVKKRSKISSQPYQGYPNILDLTEGNPRWILNLAEYLDTARRSKSSEISSQGVQAEAIRSFKDKFISMLRVYPVGKGISSKEMTPFDVLSKLGGHIEGKVYESSFSPDPALSFVIDKAAVEQHGELISICIHLGALVLVDTDSKDSAFIPGAAGLEGRHVRLCNRLAPEFYIPLRAGRSIQMSTALDLKSLNGGGRIIKPKSARMAKPKLPAPVLTKESQMNLF
ncbi:hypothetical protein ODI84_13405 [Pseudomonas putida]|uniref:ORC-CDC6 family AAA ATPase n=1 Tax=Pseudomonas putida TaxID=303 RepID=UPI002D1F070D|nr:hypothetical protein [Pseudomonas putida]MEB3901161.1 hypothetical protein [Pseudomonas putida]